VSKCYSTGSATGNECVGGLVGQNGQVDESNNRFPGTVRDSDSTGSVTGVNGVGGLVGANYVSAVNNSYATGSVTGVDYVGGLAGVNADSVVSSSYSIGSVTGNSSVGGLVGINWEGTGTVNNSFWDIETSGQSASAGGTGKNTTEMQDIATFTGAGWSIAAIALNETNPSYIWNIVNNMTYPFLSWQPV
jgi:hypothetical protein